MARPPSRYWAVAQTKSASSGEAIRRLSDQGFETYHPKFREPPVRGVRAIKPLFPGYLFVHVSREHWKPVHYTRDVRNVFMSGEHPAKVRDIEIERLRSLENSQGYVEPDFAKPGTFKRGQSVVATRGIFKDQYGTYRGLADTRSDHRVRVLFTLMGREMVYELSAFDLASVAA